MDVLRHSFASYHLRHHRNDLNLTAQEPGTHNDEDAFTALPQVGEAGREHGGRWLSKMDSERRNSLHW